MTTDQLRRELTRLADTAPVAHVSRDTWRRARHSLVRDRIAGTVATVALLAGGALAVSPLLRQSDQPDATLPAHYSAKGDAALPVEDDLAVGAAALAYPLADGNQVHVVVATATDDTHHVLALPGLPRVGNHLPWAAFQPLRLSPDGTELAYPIAPDGDGQGVAGVGVVDLRTGDVRRTTLPQPLAFANFAWSPAGSWLVWFGEGLSGDQPDGSVAGLVGPDGTSSPLTDASAELTPGDDGTVAILPAGRPIRLWKDGQELSRVDEGPPGHAETAELRDGVVSELRVVVDPQSDAGSRTLLMRHGPDADSGQLPDYVALARVFGWTADGAVLTVGATDATRSTVYRVELTDGKVSVQKVMTLDALDTGHLTLATALPAALQDGDDQPVWPWLLAGGGLLVVAAGVLLVQLRSALQVRRDLRLA
jgi:hypothetical protein